MQIAKDKVVAIDYTLKGPDGDVLDSSEGREPLSYIHGTGNIIPGLEKALEGKAKGDSVEVTVEPAEAYGERNEALIQEVSKGLFEGVDKIEPGMQFQAMSDSGPRLITVKAVDGDQVTIDGNHPLAGVTLDFNVNVVDVRDAEKEELEHGHVHGPEGQEH